MRKGIVISLIITLLLLNLSSAKYYTYNTVESNEAKYTLKLRVWNNKLTGSSYAPSTNSTVDLEDDLGFGNNRNFLTVDFNYRLSTLNSVGFAYFSGDHEAVRNLTRQITIPGDPNDITFNVNVNIFSEIRYSAFDVFYRRYFSSDQNHDFYGLLTIRFNNMRSNFVGRDNNGNIVQTASFNVNAPTVYVGVGGNFKLSHNFGASYQVQGLSLSVGNGEINTIEYQVGFNYNLTQKWGLNIGYRYNSTKGEDNLARSLNLRYQGLAFGINGRF
ncbi:MAG: hypothetical protein ACK4GR_05915 [bacterium]